jgi:restriction system protein
MRHFIVGPDKTPDLPGMMLATLIALRSLGGSAHIVELDEAIAEAEGVTEEEQSHMMSEGSRPRFNYYLAWARTYLRRSGYIENSKRGVWATTEAGERVDDIATCRAAHETVLREERERQRNRREDADRRSDAPAPEEDPVNGNPVETEGWEKRLLAVVGRMSPDAFERLAQRLLREAGFTKVEVRGKTGDGGIDGVGVLRVNLVSFQIYFQCKRWVGSVGAREIRDFRGALQGRADKGLFITPGTYTAQASDEATRDGAIAIDQIDGDRLVELLKDLKLGVSTELVESVLIDEDWFASV